MHTSITVESGSRSGICSRYPTLISFLKVIFPESYTSLSQIILSKVDLPVPFFAIIPILSPSFTPNVISPKRSLSPYDFDKFSICNKLSIRQN